MNKYLMSFSLVLSLCTVAPETIAQTTSAGMTASPGTSATVPAQAPVTTATGASVSQSSTAQPVNSTASSSVPQTVPQTVPQVVQQQVPQTISQPINQTVPRSLTIPQSTAIIVSFPAPVAVNVEDNDDEYPLTLPLAQAILDDQGNVIVPENTPVSLVLKPAGEGAQIVARSIVIGGQIVEIAAASPVIPSARVTHQTSSDRAMENGAVLGRLAGSAFGFMNNGDPDQFDLGAMGGSAIGLVSGLLSNGRKDDIVQIPQGSVYVLSLEAPIEL